MTEDAITQHIIDTLSGGHFVVADDNTAFFAGAGNTLAFATIVTKDSDLDSASNLQRTDTFRLDVSVGKEAFQSLFGEPPPATDPAALDTPMPHPVHARLYWLSVINPSAKTFDTLKPLIAQARELSSAQGKGIAGL